MMFEAKDAVSLLKQDHRTVEDLFSEYDKADRKDRKKSIAREICLELTIHAKIEEEIFYPACEGKVDEELVREAEVEHDGAKVLIAEIEAAKEIDAFFDAKVRVLQEQIEHHVKEEERRLTGLFSQAKRAGLDMDALGAELKTRKEELKAKFKKEGLPKPEMVTLKETSLA